MSAVDSFAGQVNHSMMIMMRVGGEGSVAEQLLDPESLARLENADPGQLARVGALYAKAAEAARQAREAAAPLYEIAFARD